MIEYLELEGTYQDYQSPSLAERENLNSNKYFQEQLKNNDCGVLHMHDSAWKADKFTEVLWHQKHITCSFHYVFFCVSEYAHCFIRDYNGHSFIGRILPVRDV